MDLRDSAEEAAFRAEVRAWLEERFPAWKEREGIAGGPYTTEQARSWHRVLHEGGWAAPLWPPQYGGRGLTPALAMIWEQERTRAGASIPFNIPGFGMAGPTIMAHGTDEQKDRYLPPLLSGDELWCQLFSEPGAGSDLASLSTRAVRDGDDWVVDGQKVWSSGAHEADWGILLARYDPDLPKHKGLIYLLLDMRTPGIDVRPLTQMDGAAHFNEVFLTGVRVPDGSRLGEPGDGWRIAITTLMNERMAIGAATAGFAVPFDQLVELAHRRQSGGLDPLIRDRLAQVYTRNRTLELLYARVVSKLGKGQIPDAEGSIMKLVLSDLVTDSAEVGMSILGAGGTVLNGEDGVARALLGERAFHIGGGTDEVQRNVIAERVLGLPRDPQPDKDVPFSARRG